MWHSRPPPDPPVMANAILNFHFNFLNPSLIQKCTVRLEMLAHNPAKDISYGPMAACATFQFLNHTFLTCLCTQKNCNQSKREEHIFPVLEIEFGPPHTNFGSVWSSQKKKRKSQQLNRQNNSLWIGKVAEISVSCDPLYLLKKMK